MMVAIFLATDPQGATIEDIATKTGVTENKAPEWIKHGAYVYRLGTPDADASGIMPSIEEGMLIASNLFDKSVQQIPIVHGLIGHDHTGGWNWDGMWPYWNRVTFRGGNWDTLSNFMKRVNEKCNTKLSFHVNLTDVNIGLKDYPETQEFFKKLVEAKAIYRRDINPETKKRDKEPPYVPQEIPAKEKDPISIFALVNYKNFWDSGLARQMIDEFYGHLPYPPPVLYLDVLNPGGGNFGTGYPDGPLRGSKETQIEGILAIAKYLRSKGTEVGTEGDRDFMQDYGTYGWLHCQPGYSKDDYSKILGAAKDFKVFTQHVYGNTGGFFVSPIACTPGQIKKVKTHYKELLSGAAITRKMPGLETWHVSEPGQNDTVYNQLPGPKGGGDPFRGDWIDLVNHFYLTGIQELYHIGKGNYRTAVYNKIGAIHIRKFVLVDPSGKEVAINVEDCLTPEFPSWKVEQIKKTGVYMLEWPLSTKFNAPQSGKYKVKVYGSTGQPAGMNIYVNGVRQLTQLNINFPSKNDNQESDLGEITLEQGENTISFDAGPVYVKWNDGTTAIWETPSIGKGFKVTNGDVTFADDYDRMWPATWSEQKKIYFYSWDGTNRKWKLPQDWEAVKKATLYPLTPYGRGKGIPMTIEDRSVTPKLLPQVPCILVPEGA